LYPELLARRPADEPAEAAADAAVLLQEVVAYRGTANTVPVPVNSVKLIQTGNAVGSVGATNYYEAVTVRVKDERGKETLLAVE
jgi:hypothetical protein